MKTRSPNDDSEVNISGLLEIFRQNPLNIDKLKEYGRVYGFGNALGRNLAWTKLTEAIQVENFLPDDFLELKKKAKEVPTQHKYVHQIFIDVERSLNTIDVFENLPPEKIKYHRGNLDDLLQTFFSLYQNYHYFQGFHDVGTVIYYVLGNDKGIKAMQKMAYVYFRDALKYPFEESVTLQLKLILRIARVFDPWFADTVSSFYEGVPMFAVPWMLTWFSHSLKEMNTILRIFDYLISSPPHSILYMCAAVLLVTKKKLLSSIRDLDMMVLHSFFQNLEIPNIEVLISTTIEIEKRCDIYKLISSLEKPFPDQSSLTTTKAPKIIEQYYKHRHQSEAKQNLTAILKSGKRWRQQMGFSLLIGLLLILVTFLFNRYFPNGYFAITS